MSQRGKLLANLVMVAVAAMAWFGASSSLEAHSGIGCMYAGQCYSAGACIQSVCGGNGRGQKCSTPLPDCEGAWSACGGC